MDLKSTRKRRSPVVIAAFEGWSDAADSSSAVLDHLEAVFNSEVIAEIDPEDYYDLREKRPTASRTPSGARQVVWPTTRLSIVRTPRLSRDLVLIRGIEPNMRWRAFSAELLEAVRARGARTVVTLETLLADTPHARPVPVSATTENEGTAAKYRIMHRSKYNGPYGVLSVFADIVADAGLDSVHLQAAVPHYVANPPCPKATLALLHKVQDLLDLEIPPADLPERAQAWEREVDELVAGDAETAEYVKSLEARE
ncbi:PAC2 family protein [Frankia sp. CiP3]|uniref:PAC2 family protein n=1 Tax=Frankia sp. CiP3 TaxID=2880971 RepID=UPI001EF5598E|nr:PAC2 family protein [Frankia sp. CiP3]